MTAAVLSNIGEPENMRGFEALEEEDQAGWAAWVWRWGWLL